MAGEKFANKAVAKLLAYTETNLATYLRAVETAESMSSGSLTDPDDYAAAKLPRDNRCFVGIFCERSEEYEHDKGLHANDCIIGLHFSGDADFEAGQLKARRYETALTNMLMQIGPLATPWLIP